jgi:hypothetical protein
MTVCTSKSVVFLGICGWWRRLFKKVRIKRKIK